MTNLTPVDQWDGIYQLEENDPVQGGVGGVSNLPLQNLTNRTERIHQSLLDVGIDIVNKVYSNPTTTEIGPVRKATDLEIQNGSSVVNAFIDPEQFKKYNGVVEMIGDLRLREGYDGEIIYLKCHTSLGDGGHGSFRWDASSTASDDNGVTIAVTGVATGRWVRQHIGPYTPEMYGDIYGLAAANPVSVLLDSDVYTILADVTFLNPISKFVGVGMSRTGSTDAGSVIEGDGGLIFDSPTTAFGLDIADFNMDYTGVGTAITISNFLNSHIRNIFLDLNGIGDTGVDYSDDATYFSILENSTITSFKGTGVKLNSNGTKGVVRDCNIGSTQETAVASVEVNVPGTEIIGGQLNIDRSDGLGVGVLFNNTSGATHQGGLVDSVLSERDTLVKITGTTHGWTNVVIRNTRHTMGQTSTAVIFDRAIECTLDNPSLYGPTANYLAEFTANAIRCGIIGGYEVCRANLIVNAAATGCWKRCVTPISYADRANITVYPNLITTVDDCQYVGKTIHNGTSWDKFSVSIPDDSFATFVPPELFGTMEISSTSGGGDYILANYNVQVGACSQIAVASSSVVNASNGTLTGTTGVDGQLTVRCSSDGNVYVENRRGGNRRVIIHFKSPGPNT